jgi:hypothetical protein
MLEISISSEMAAEHPRFVAECLERGHRVEVFASCAETHESGGGPTTSVDVAAVDQSLLPVRPQEASRR